MCNNWLWIVLVIWFLSGQNNSCGTTTTGNGCYNVNTTIRRGNGCGCTETVTNTGCGCNETTTNNGCYNPCY